MIATRDLDKSTLNQVFRFCHQAGLECSIYTEAEDHLREQEKEEFLIHEKIKDWTAVVEEEFNRGHVHNTFENRSAMLVGADPKLVGDLAGRLAVARLSHLYVAEKFEHHLNELMAHHGHKNPAMPISFGYAPERLLDRPSRGSGLPDVLVYMGTRKYPFLLNVQPIEVVEDNLIRPWELCRNYVSGRGGIFVFGSAVGAANPGHVIQKALALSETYLTAAATGERRVCVVRLPSVVDGTGAIIEKIRRQISSGQEVTISHHQEARYFTTVAEAAKFILHAIFILNSKRRSHQTFQYKTTRRVKVADLVEKMRHEYSHNGGSPKAYASINHENGAIWREAEIDTDGDRYIPTEYNNILIVRTDGRPAIDLEEIAANISAYGALARAGDEKGLYDRVVGDYEKYVGDKV